MKQLKIFLLLILLPTMIFAEEIQISLHSNWQFRQVGKEAWLNAEVPGTVHTDLLKNGKIEDPFYRTNEKDQQWIEKEDWEYKTIFSVDDEIITKDRILLDFQGLDTYGDVYLNDSLILSANNMFRSWQVDMENIIKKGDNELRVYFHSPISKTEPVYDSLRYTIPVSSNDQSAKKLSVFSRKAPYHFGWDWGPRFVTSGIWRPVTLKAWNTAIIKDAFLERKSLTKQSCSFLAHLEYDVTRPFIGELEILIDGLSIKKSVIELNHGSQKDNITFSIENPELWWPNGMGDQKLYEIEIQLKKDGKIIHSKKIRTGLRTIELVQDEDKRGTSFYFKVNGKSVFMKGANYIPQDNFLPRVTPEKYEHILQSAAVANMNMIRVWGGGIYENDIFYELCDEKGLLVWQDFMFACAMYPSNNAFLDNVKYEAEENVKRLRHHPSIALWCGNNEILTMWKEWRNNENEEGGQVPLWKNPEDSLKLVKAYDDIFKNILPKAVIAHSSGVPYWESSPSSSGGGYENLNSGDSHYWGVWWGQEPFEAYRKNIGRFMSEYGFQSFPEFTTVKSYTDDRDWDIYSNVMKAHQRSSIGNETIAKYMEGNFNEPKDFENFLYVSQMLQAEGMKIAMEAHRVKKPYNMGSLIWQLNDCWPVASWSSIDYYGRWKALHYYTKRAFNDIIVTFEAKNDEIKIHAVTDRYEELKAKLIIELIGLDGKKIHSEEKKFRVKANSSKEIWKGSKKILLKKQQKDEVYLKAKIVTDENVIAENHFIFVTYKELDLDIPDIKYDFKKTGGKLFVKLVSNKTAFGVCFDSGDLNLQFSDNYFTLYPRESKLIEIMGDVAAHEIRNKLTVNSLADSYSH